MRCGWSWARTRAEIGFCVLYPGLCLPAAGGQAAYPTAAEQQLIQEGSPYEIRFAALEWWERVSGQAD